MNSFGEWAHTNALDVSALNDPKVRAQMKTVNFIGGLDLSKNKMPVLFFGVQEMVESVLRPAEFEGVQPSCIIFWFDSGNDTLEKIKAAVLDLCGRCDYDWYLRGLYKAN
jgi:hypothetical protein